MQPEPTTTAAPPAAGDVQAFLAAFDRLLDAITSIDPQTVTDLRTDAERLGEQHAEWSDEHRDGPRETSAWEWIAGYLHDLEFVLDALPDSRRDLAELLAETAAEAGSEAEPARSGASLADQGGQG